MSFRREIDKTKRLPSGMEKKGVPLGADPGWLYIEDRGAVYAAPLDVVWDFWARDEKFHPKAHRGEVRNFVDQKLSEVTTLISYEKREGTEWRKLSCRMTIIPPAVRVQEDLDGPYAGSTTVFLYTPKGSKTIVDVLTFRRSSEMTPKQIESDTRRMFANAYREDLPWFRKYVRSRKGKR